MKSELVKVGAPTNELERAEARIMAAEAARFEEGFAIAIELEKIKQKRLFKHCGMKTWEEYCRSDRVQYNKRHANQLILSLKYRRALPDHPGAIAPGSGWTESSVRPLTKLSTPAVAKNCAKAAIAVYEKAVEEAEKENKKPPTFLSVIKESVRRVLNTRKEQRAKQAEAAEKLREANPVNVIRGLEKKARTTLIELEQMGEDFWTAVEEEAPGAAARAAQELEKLAAFLRS